MKALIVVLLAGVTYAATGPVFAGRDESLMMPLRQAIEKKQAENLARAQQAQTGLAGPTGVPGKAGPGTEPVKARRDPTTHP